LLRLSTKLASSYDDGPLKPSFFIHGRVVKAIRHAWFQSATAKRLQVLSGGGSDVPLSGTLRCFALGSGGALVGVGEAFRFSALDRSAIIRFAGSLPGFIRGQLR
jgi:hypothetical protein